MAYSAEISRTNPACFLFLIDQSGSMQEVLAPADIQPMAEPTFVDGKSYSHTASGKTKADAVADAINRLLQNLVLLCAKPEGVRDYFHIGVLGYGGDNTSTRVVPAFGGVLGGKDLVPINEIANNPARVAERTKKVDDGAGGLVDQRVKFPIWFEPVANGGTPMCNAFARAHSILSAWVAQHAASYPPVVINITDGEATDGDPSNQAEAVRSVSTADGPALIFTCHMSATQSSPIEYPDSEAGLPDQYSKQMFRMSSQLTPPMQSLARQQGLRVNEGSRGFVLNADMVALIRFLEIGTRPSNLR